MLEGCTPWPEEFVSRYRKAGYWRDQTIGEMLDESAGRFGAREAVVGGDGTRYTYQDLKRLSDRLALHFLEIGLRPRDTVLMQLNNVADFVPVYFGLQKAGIIPVMCLPQHRLHELGYFGELAEPTGYIIPSEVKNFNYSDLARQLRERVPSIKHILADGDDVPPGSHALKKLLADPIEERAGLSQLSRVRPDPMEICLFMLSGGTTGLPKLIPRNHNEFLCYSRSILDYTPYGEDSVFLDTLPIAHNFALGHGLQSTLMSGGKFVISQSPELDPVMSLVEKERVTIFPGVPTLFIRMMNYPGMEKYDTSSVKAIINGSQKLQPELKPKVEKIFGAPVQEGLGMGEGLICMPRIDDPQVVRYQTVGRPLCPGDEMRIVDEQGRDVPEGEVGELIARGPDITRGYFKAPEHNQAAFDKDGFYRTGDLVRVGPQGGLVIEGRRKDMINRGGEHISAEEIENLIVTHPAVQNVAVVGMPDKEMGERICAYVLPAPGQTVTLSGLCSYLQSKDIAKFKLPERLEMVGEFPLTNIGKVSKQSLRQDIANKLKENP